MIHWLRLSRLVGGILALWLLCRIPFSAPTQPSHELYPGDERHLRGSPLSIIGRWMEKGQSQEAGPSATQLETVFPIRDAVGQDDFVPLTLHKPADCISKEYIVYVKNRPESVQARDFYRAQKGELFGNNPVVFVVGTTDDQGVNTMLANEISEHGDILEGDFEDNYQTLRMKELIRLKHFVDECDAPASLMIDDDVKPKLTDRVVRSMLWNDEKVHCLFKQWDWESPWRGEDSRWFTPMDEYPLDYWPSYCAGPCFAVGRRAAENILRAASEHQFSNAGSKSDVYLTGILRVISGTEIESFVHVCPSHTDLSVGLES